MGDKLTWFEFFAGGGMARLGLGDGWECAFANEWSEKKAAAYTSRFGTGTPKTCKELVIDDVANLKTSQLKGHPDLTWASFPCQDLSLAGMGAGLNGDRSGTFKPFWQLMEGLAEEHRKPRVVVLENVVGAITSHGGRDFTEILRRICRTGYRVGPMVIDGVHFVPQSRPRLFVVAVADDATVPAGMEVKSATDAWHPAVLRNAFSRLPQTLKDGWIWWSMPLPPQRTTVLAELIELEPNGVKWHSKEQTKHLLNMMSELNRRKVKKAQATGERKIGTIYRRTRPNKDGEKVQRAEVRFDSISGCLRTPAGGSSRQIILVVEGESRRSRLLSPREAARLMGVPEDYPIPPNYNEAYHLFGDGLIVPAVSWLNKHILMRLARPQVQEAAA